MVTKPIFLHIQINVYANIFEKDFQEVGWGGRKWMDLAQGGDRWRVLVKAAMSLRVL
jgi:hypothetical protein